MKERTELSNRSPGNIPSDLKRRVREGTWNYREYITSEDYSQVIEDGPSKADKKDTMSRYQHIYMVGDKVDLDMLRRCMWDNGCHKKVRYSTWKMVLGYLPEWTYLHEPVLEVRRNSYRDAVKSIPSLTAGDQEEDTQCIKQLIRSGLSNTALKIPLFRSAKLSKMLERVIHLWLLDNSEQPYVDLLSRIPIPLTYAFLDEYGDPETLNVDSTLSDAVVFQLEVDVYNCMTLLLQGSARKILSGDSSELLHRIEEIVKKIDPQLAEHLSANVSYADFALQWLDTLLIDQLQKISLTVFLWDRYFASGDFVDFHLAVCAFLLARFEGQIKKLRQQDLLQFLQALPLHHWDYAHLEGLIDRLQESSATGIVPPPHLDYVELKALAYHRAKLGLTGSYAKSAAAPAQKPHPPLSSATGSSPALVGSSSSLGGSMNASTSSAVPDGSTLASAISASLATSSGLNRAGSGLSLATSSPSGSMTSSPSGSMANLPSH